MTMSEIRPKDWQEERFTLQRLLVRTSLFASGQDAAADELLEELRRILKHETCDLATLRQLQSRFDQALEALDERRFRSERNLRLALERILEALGELERNSRKGLRTLEKQVDDLADRGDELVQWLTTLADLLEQSQGQPERPPTRGWRRWFGLHEREPASEAEAPPAAEIAIPTTTPDDSGDARLNIARRVGDLLGHVLNQVSLDAPAHARAMHLRQRLEMGSDWDELRDVLNEIVDLIIAAVSRGRLEFESFLRRLDERLAALKLNCKAQVDARLDQRNAAEALDSEVSQQLQDIEQAIGTAHSLDELKASVSANIQALSTSFRTYREDECRREAMLEKELAAMQEKVAGLEAYSEQVQEKLRAERARSLTDMLTQLPNREAWQERLQFEFDRWQRYHQPVVMAVLDIDLFKRVNDSYGHKAGDRVIQLVAKTLCDRLRSTDFVARYGGEEFVILLPETTMEAAFKVIDNLREHVAQLPFHFQDQPVTITVSAGLVAFGDAATADDLFDTADKALYQAKRDGRNRVAHLGQ
ncbi:GGDEF domain-containing protein [Marinobacter bohaiensis]|uniref:GGDEF domain-containing protein n=1 Tax=Marinobacter bohaiensis TaxID=2201898 RepID=UPI000DAE0720|nr:GGDEF domain-containing protein [Marinobacter bohaiensis]